MAIMMIARNIVLDTHSSKVSLAYISRTSATQGLHPWNGSGAQFGVCITLDGENGMGGLMGGRGTAAFGSHSASVLTKTTMVFVILFFALTVGLALVNKTPKVKGDLVPVTETQTETETTSESSTDWWSSTESNSETVTE